MNWVMGASDTDLLDGMFLSLSADECEDKDQVSHRL